MERFRTTFDIPPAGFELGYGGAVLAVGSCFASSISDRLRAAKFDVVAGPTGVVFNPLSVAAALRDAVSGRVVGRGELEWDPSGGVWSSFSFHGSFSDPDPDAALQKMNGSLRAAHEAVGRVRTVVLTLGSAWVYELAAGGGVVANCHKFPAGRFVRRRLSVGEAVGALSGALDALPSGVDVILTVSPVRHLRDGAQGGGASKAVLLLAAEELCGSRANVHYFPAYELMMDDLRDYRFYGRDMVHPTDEAVEYIWDRFRDWAMNPAVRATVADVEALNRALGHRPLNPRSAARGDFRRATLRRIDLMSAAHPYLDFTHERTLLEADL